MSGSVQLSKQNSVVISHKLEIQVDPGCAYLMLNQKGDTYYSCFTPELLRVIQSLCEKKQCNKDSNREKLAQVKLFLKLLLLLFSNSQT